ncbi:hypothetical protein LTR99_011078 [Exophiala xenobiotica]|uniref:Protein kinase domain-containing protein n=1 Tax=Vermiconidia calcicola TaxID=1690605 RepID=A0AAV9PUU5_9PEZI|nr:hypothetical protein LTR99_011078 [Exophiala xenobiotica]KAK5401653.1 hypothetical protein LTR06_011017 [Exophiala xenobiotica]KAK5425471.1 hypothetical protein LTR34_011079 [Exophiala xenobiotica]KAK5527600.1 hypothetical protein LTR25_011049 [Vermiconidia calcicola]
MFFIHKPRQAPSSKQRRHASISYGELQYLAAGRSGTIYAIDEKRILKEYHERTEGDVERLAYERLGSHPNIARYLGSTKDGSIILERGQVLRSVCQKIGAAQTPLQKKLRWVRDAAEGIKHAHGKNIVQADCSCNNMILTRSGDLKIIDFEGCSIDGAQAGSQYEWFSYRRSTPLTDIFAFGCAIFEIMTGTTPYNELEKFTNRSSLVEQLYRENQFPDVTHLPLGDLMQQCWNGTFTSMNDIIHSLDADRTARSKANVEGVIYRVLKQLVCRTNRREHG